MARRRGIFRRIADAIGDLFKAGKTPSTPEREPPLEPPYEPPPAPTGPGLGNPIPDDGDYLERRLHSRYRAIEGTDNGYLDWLGMFETLSIDFEDDAEHVYLWEQFLRAFTKRADDPASIPRDRFYRETGIPASAIDWSLWRDLTGYKSRK